MTLASDLLLVSGRTWIDDIAGIVESLAVTAETQYAADRGEQLRLVSVGKDSCAINTSVAVRPWGHFVALNHEFSKAHATITVSELFRTLARYVISPAGVGALKGALDLQEYDWRVFQRTGVAAASALLREDGWQELNASDEVALQESYRLVFHPGIIVEDVFPHAVVGSQRCQIDTSAVREFFESSRIAFWTLEDEVRHVLAEALDEYGSKCARLVVFCVDHGTYVIERPECGWTGVAPRAWPVHLLNCGGDVLVLAPDIEEGIALNEVRRELTACGPVVSDRIARWALEGTSRLDVKWV